MTNSTKEKNPSKRKTKSKSKSGAIETFEDAFIHELSDMKNAEMQLIKALPKMAKAASDQELAKAFETHLKETQQQIELIDKAVKSADIKLKREKCDAMEGLIAEGKEIIQNVDEGAVRDVMLIAAAQKVEHYEIASYGCLVAAAKQLGFAEAAELLEQILNQEKKTDQKLNQLAENGLNQEAGQQNPTQLKGSTTMARYDNNRQSNGGNNGRRTPERDDEGRFMSDDDRGYGRGQDRDYDDNRPYARSNRDDDGRYSSRNRDDYDDNRSTSRSNRDDDDNRGYSNGGRNTPRRDEDGRFMSDDDRDDRQSSSRSRYYNNDDYNNGRYSRASNDSDYDDNRGRRSASSGEGRGWFGDSAGHARAGRHSHDNDRGRSSERR